MYQAVQKAANDADECKQMLVNMQRQLDRMEEKQDEVVRGGRFNGSLLESKDENKDKAMQDGDEGKPDKKTPISSIIKKFEATSCEDSSDEEEDEEKEEDEEEEERSPGGRSKVALVAMAGGAILIGGALQHQLR